MAISYIDFLKERKPFKTIEVLQEFLVKVIPDEASNKPLHDKLSALNKTLLELIERFKSEKTAQTITNTTNVGNLAGTLKLIANALDDSRLENTSELAKELRKSSETLYKAIADKRFAPDLRSSEQIMGDTTQARVKAEIEAARRAEQASGQTQPKEAASKTKAEATTVSAQKTIIPVSLQTRVPFLEINKSALISTISIVKNTNYSPGIKNVLGATLFAELQSTLTQIAEITKTILNQPGKENLRELVSNTEDLETAKNMLSALTRKITTAATPYINQFIPKFIYDQTATQLNQIVSNLNQIINEPPTELKESRFDLTTKNQGCKTILPLGNSPLLKNQDAQSFSCYIKNGDTTIQISTDSPYRQFKTLVDYFIKNSNDFADLQAHIKYLNQLIQQIESEGKTIPAGTVTNIQLKQNIDKILGALEDYFKKYSEYCLKDGQTQASHSYAQLSVLCHDLKNFMSTYDYPLSPEVKGVLTVGLHAQSQQQVITDNQITKFPQAKIVVKL